MVITSFCPQCVLKNLESRQPAAVLPWKEFSFGYLCGLSWPVMLMVRCCSLSVDRCLLRYQLVGLLFPLGWHCLRNVRSLRVTGAPVFPGWGLSGRCFLQTPLLHPLPSGVIFFPIPHSVSPLGRWFQPFVLAQNPGSSASPAGTPSSFPSPVGWGPRGRVRRPPPPVPHSCIPACSRVSGQNGRSPPHHPWKFWPRRLEYPYSSLL